MLINKRRCEKKRLEYQGYMLFFCSIGKYEKEFLITLQRLVAPPALGNWGAKQEL
jgi:hypothetical protein